jgi:hypothetical protein
MSDVDQGQGLPETPADDAIEADSSPAQLDEGTETTQEGEQPTEKQRPWYQKRIDEITAARREAERRADQLLAMLEQTTQTQRTPQPQAEPQPAQGRPVLENFESYEEFSEALADWKVEQKFAEREQRQQAETAAQAQKRQHDEWMSRVVSVEQRSPEVRDAIEAIGPTLLPETAGVLKALENGPDVLVHLYQHRDVAERIASLDPYMAAVELGRLSAGIQPPQPRRVTVPPKPINTLGGGASPTPFDPSTIKDGDEYKRWRDADLKAKRNAQ